MAKKPAKRIEERKSVSPVLARLLNNAPTTTVRDCVYTRGFNLQHDTDYRAVGLLECMKQGVLAFNMRRSDLQEDRANVQGSVVRDAIINGKYLEAFRADGVQVGLKADIPTSQFLLNNTMYLGVAGRVFMEVENGFAPYVFLGWREEGYTYPLFVRIQISLEHDKTKLWFNELKATAKKFVY